MIRRMYFVFLILLIQSCSSTAPNAHKADLPSSSLPRWVFSPSDVCDVSTELCSSGEGNSFSESDLSARKSLASVFSTKIRYEFEVNKMTTLKADKTEINERITRNLNQEVDQVLKSSSIKTRFEKEGAFYSLAILDKKKAQKIIKSKIEKLDDQLVHQYRLKNRLYLKKMLVAFHTRSELNEKLVILSNKSIAAPLTISQIKLLKFISTGKEKIFVDGDTTLPKNLVDKFKTMLTDLNYKLVPKNASNFAIRFNFSQKETYLNVEGFKKMIYFITVQVTSPAGGNIGGYSFEVATQGRTAEDCLNKMMKEAINKFEENIEKLNLK